MKELLRLVRLFLPYWKWLVLGILASLATLIANVGLLALSGWFITAMALAGAAGVSMNYFTPAAAIRAFAIVRTVGRYGERLITHEATFRLLARLRVWFYEHLEPLAPARLQQYRAGDLLSRIQADIDTLDHFYVRVLVPLAVGLAGIALGYLFLSRYSVKIALIALAFLLLAGVALPLALRRLGAAPGRRMVESSAELRAALVDGLQGMGELTVFGGAERHARHIERLSLELIAQQKRMSRLTGLGQGALGLCANLALWLAVVAAIPLLQAGTLARPDLPMLALFVLASFEAVMPLPQAFQMLGQTIAAARRLLEVVDARPQVREPAGPSPVPRDFGLQIRDLRFRYAATGPWALDGIDLDLAAGRRVAVVGASGSGKTSIANVLLRFWEYQEGTIRLGGHDLREYRSDDIRRLVAVVAQDAHLFNATIRDNLLLANPGADDAALIRACQAAQLHDFIAAQPEGYDSYVGEAGMKLSGGQARRLAIARALLKDAPILILDEPTEGLDAATEQALLQSLDRLMAGRTVLLVSHRPAALDTVDEVLVLDRGRIVERGAPRVLAAQGRHYRALHHVMTGTTVPTGGLPDRGEIA